MLASPPCRRITRHCTAPRPRRSPRTPASPPTDLKVEAPPRPELGDLAVGCFAIAKARKQNPAAGRPGDRRRVPPTELLASATAAGPFVNFRANRAAAFRWLIDARAARHAACRASSAPARRSASTTARRTSPSTSPITTSAARRSATRSRRSFRALGYRVVGINFLGDWGTTHGMLLAAWTALGPDRAARRHRAQRALRPVPRRDEGRPGARAARAARGSSGSRTAIPRRARCGSGSATCRGPSSQAVYEHARHRRTTRSAARARTSPTCRA